MKLHEVWFYDFANFVFILTEARRAQMELFRSTRVEIAKGKWKLGIT